MFPSPVTYVLSNILMHIPWQQFSQHPCQLSCWLICPQCPECGIDYAPHFVPPQVIPPQADFQGYPSHLGPRPLCSCIEWRTQPTCTPPLALCDGASATNSLWCAFLPSPTPHTCQWEHTVVLNIMPPPSWDKYYLMCRSHCKQPRKYFS